MKRIIYHVARYDDIQMKKPLEGWQALETESVYNRMYFPEMYTLSEEEAKKRFENTPLWSEKGYHIGKWYFVDAVVLERITVDDFDESETLATNASFSAKWEGIAVKTSTWEGVL